MLQSRRKRARNFPVRTQLKTTYKKALDLIKSGKSDEAKKYLPLAYRIIDMAAKKNIIHDKNADRKKSRIALALNELEKKGGRVASEKPEVVEGVEAVGAVEAVEGVEK